MTTMQSAADLVTDGWKVRGDAVFESGQTIEKDTGRATAMADLTLVAYKVSSGKYVPMTDVDPALTSAYLTCGANGGVIAAYELVTDGEFSITVDGEVIDVTGLDFDTATDFQQVEDTINVALGDKALCVYDSLGDVFLFYSKKQGLPASSITVLSAVSGGSGTDISGASYLNGLTSVGTVTAATGEVSTAIPAGFYHGPSITAAALVADDVDGVRILKGKTVEVDEDAITLENSLDLDDVIPGTNTTIRHELGKLGIFVRSTAYFQQSQPLS